MKVNVERARMWADDLTGKKIKGFDIGDVIDDSITKPKVTKVPSKFESSLVQSKASINKMQADINKYKQLRADVYKKPVIPSRDYKYRVPYTLDDTYAGVTDRLGKGDFIIVSHAKPKKIKTIKPPKPIDKRLADKLEYTKWRLEASRDWRMTQLLEKTRRRTQVAVLGPYIKHKIPTETIARGVTQDIVGKIDIASMFKAPPSKGYPLPIYTGVSITKQKPATETEFKPVREIKSRYKPASELKLKPKISQELKLKPMTEVKLKPKQKPALRAGIGTILVPQLKPVQELKLKPMQQLKVPQRPKPTIDIPFSGPITPFTPATPWVPIPPIRGKKKKKKKKRYLWDAYAFKIHPIPTAEEVKKLIKGVK
jgi:hypothetical protein